MCGGRGTFQSDVTSTWSVREETASGPSQCQQPQQDAETVGPQKDVVNWGIDRRRQVVNAGPNFRGKERSRETPWPLTL